MFLWTGLDPGLHQGPLYDRVALAIGERCSGGRLEACESGRLEWVNRPAWDRAVYTLFKSSAHREEVKATAISLGHEWLVAALQLDRPTPPFGILCCDIVRAGVTGGSRGVTTHQGSPESPVSPDKGHRLMSLCVPMDRA